jgi:hypothetical protein
MLLTPRRTVSHVLMVSDANVLPVQATSAPRRWSSALKATTALAEKKRTAVRVTTAQRLPPSEFHAPPASTALETTSMTLAHSLTVMQVSTAQEELHLPLLLME